MGRRDSSARAPFSAYRAFGPVVALVVLVLAFGLAIGSFLDIDNLSVVVQQSLVTGTLALGQLLIVRAGGIDLANAAVAVLGTLLIAELALTGTPGVLALLVGVLAAAAVGAVAGGLVTWPRLPPFVVTFGMLVIVTAVSRIYAQGRTFPVVDDALGFLGTTKYLLGRVELTYGMGVLLALAVGLWFALTRTAWGTGQRVLSRYVVAGVIYGIAAWQALGRVPIADPNAFQLGNLDSIVAVVIGGTSPFGGRVSVLGTVVGALVVAVLRTGLTQVGVDTLYQDVAIGVLLLAAVAVDRFSQGRQR
ncbi:MAG: ABC transporter permease [Actinophytocola sp.]|uniref:ABC transporter permease n=1 Tax=Actinophytocola sp. TaxID=1872138 RepID=UPI001323DAD4|nr:ABC transporter permease [Actinophytocola sp.]MPZ79439.1 ABC transporter permease [Actinophytocola sp.]